jgi:hypothetical protein
VAFDRVEACGCCPATSGSGGLETPADKNLIPNITVGNGAGTGLSLSLTPVPNGYVGVRVNGAAQEVGNGSKLLDCYFSADGGVTAKTFALIAAGDFLFWNGLIAGFNLAATDRVDLAYEV